MYLADSSQADLPAPTPVPTAVDGAPSAALLALHDDGRTQFGVWTCTPGEFTTDHAGYLEFCQVLEGEADLVGDDGTTQHLTPGSAVVIPEGWTGRWRIRQTIRKSFAIVREEQQA